MPPKGWRKSADGTYPQGQGLEKISIDELLFPRSTVQKLAKMILSQEGDDNLILAKDSLLALQRSATVFVSHLLFNATQIMKDKDRKTINSQDIFEALEKADFPGFVPEVKQQLSVYEQKREIKKKQKELQRGDGGVKKLKDNNATSKVMGEVEDDEDSVIEEDEDVMDEEDDEENDEENEEEEDNKNPLKILEDEQKELEGANEENFSHGEIEDEGEE